MPPRRSNKFKEESGEETTLNKQIQMEIFDSDTPMLTDSELTPKTMVQARATNEIIAEKNIEGESLCEENWVKTSTKVLTSVKPTDAESLFIFAVMCHMKGKPDIEWDNVALTCGYKSAGVAQVRWGQIKRKLRMSSAELKTSPMKSRAVHTPKSGLKTGGKGILRTPITARQTTPSKASRSMNKTLSRVSKNVKTPPKLSVINETALRDYFEADEFPDEMDPFFVLPSKKTAHFEPAETPMDDIRAIKKAQEEAARLAKMDPEKSIYAHVRKANRTLFTLPDDENIYVDDEEASSSKKGKRANKLAETPKMGISKNSTPKPVKLEDLYTVRFAKGSNEDVVLD